MGCGFVLSFEFHSGRYWIRREKKLPKLENWGADWETKIWNVGESRADLTPSLTYYKAGK